MGLRQESDFNPPIGAGLSADVFDRVHFSGYTMQDPQLEREIIGLFLAQLEAVELQLSGDLSAEEWKFVAHTLRGSAATVGAWALHRLAVSWEAIGLPQTLEAFAAERHTFALACLAFRNVSET